MRTVDWVILWVGVGMIAVGTLGWFLTLARTKAAASPQTRGLNPVDYVKALKDVPVVNLLIGLGVLLIILAAGWVEISVAGG